MVSDTTGGRRGMRFRRIEKDGGGMANVGLNNQHMQGKEEDVTTSDSKTYIGSNSKRKIAMNKIKHTKIGDDIHYYINGVEGRGIVVKMANEYLEVFKENGQLGTIHINDTFFVKDILINKQWNDMDDHERYDALTKIHAPSPRYITKQWSDMPEEIKVLLRKEGSTYEEGATKGSETKDHDRTGFAQNTQYEESSKPKGCKCGDPKCKDPKCKKHAEVKKESNEEYRRRRERAKKEKETGEMDLGNPDYYTVKNPKWKGDEKKIPMPQYVTDYKTGVTTKHPTGKGQFQGRERKLRHDRKRESNDSEIMRKRWEEGYAKYDKELTDKETAAASQAKEGSKPKVDKTPSAPPKDKPQGKFVGAGSTRRRVGEEPKEAAPKVNLQQAPKKKPKKDKPSGGFVIDEDDPDDISNKAIYKQWLESKEASAVLRGEYSNFITKPIPDGKGGKGEFAHCVSVNQDKDDPKAFCGAIQNATEKKKENSAVLRGEYEVYKTRVEDEDPRRGKKPKKDKEQKPEYPKTPEGDYRREEGGKHTYKSDVEHGTYGGASQAPDVGVSTDTNIDVSESTGYEERPHISVEEAGKLPRATFQTGNETNVRGGSEVKEPHKVRTKGIPEQHPNTYGMRYGMKGGVKKVWCPEHQMWEETRKDWHE